MRVASETLAVAAEASAGSAAAAAVAPPHEATFLVNSMSMRPGEEVVEDQVPATGAGRLRSGMTACCDAFKWMPGTSP